MLYKVYQIFVLIPVVILTSMWAGTTMAVMCRISHHPDWWSSFASKWWARIILAAALIRVEVKGREHIVKGETYIFAANHQGAFDIFLICGYLGVKFRWMMKRALEKVPFLGWGCKHAGYVFVDNRNPGAVRRTYRQAEQILLSGMSLAMFPEGSRSSTGEMQPFRKGAFALAEEMKMPVVPMTINGSYYILPKGKKIRFIKRHKLSLTIHKPIFFEDGEALREECYRSILSALEK